MTYSEHELEFTFAKNHKKAHVVNSHRTPRFYSFLKSAAVTVTALCTVFLAVRYLRMGNSKSVCTPAGWLRIADVTSGQRAICYNATLFRVSAIQLASLYLQRDGPISVTVGVASWIFEGGLIFWPWVRFRKKCCTLLSSAYCVKVLARSTCFHEGEAGANFGEKVEEEESKFAVTIIGHTHSEFPPLKCYIFPFLGMTRPSLNSV